MPLLEAYEASDVDIVLKFDRTVKVSTITNDKFTLVSVEATPVTIALKDIDILNDYDTVARKLTLTYDETLSTSTEYLFTVSGLSDAAGQDLPSQSFNFTTGTIVEPSLPDIPPDPIVVIEDHSIRSNAFISSDITYVSNPDFYVVDTDPEHDELLVENDRNNGRVTIKFSARPNVSYVNPTFFKAQKKIIQRAPSRWQSLDAHVSLDSTQPWVYIDFPSTDDVPVYGEADKIYFEDSYKYRIRVSKDVGI